MSGKLGKYMDIRTRTRDTIDDSLYHAMIQECLGEAGIIMSNPPKDENGYYLLKNLSIESGVRLISLFNKKDLITKVKIH